MLIKQSADAALANSIPSVLRLPQGLPLSEKKKRQGQEGDAEWSQGF